MLAVYAPRSDGGRAAMSGLDGAQVMDTIFKGGSPDAEA
jgi:hypothetical protein